MAWRRSYVFTPRVEESEIDSSDESDSEVGTETLKLYHRRKSTVTAVKARVRFIWITLYMLHKYFQTAKMHDVSWSRVPCYLFVLLRNPLWDYFQALVFKCFNPRIINLQVLLCLQNSQFAESRHQPSASKSCFFSCWGRFTLHQRQIFCFLMLCGKKT